MHTAAARSTARRGKGTWQIQVSQLSPVPMFIAVSLSQRTNNQDEKKQEPIVVSDAFDEVIPVEFS